MENIRQSTGDALLHSPALITVRLEILFTKIKLHQFT